ncbi:hypothetical protein LEP1GSC081_1758 [Leptospira kirschneri str. H1]|uniref:Uncharacterized protein n=1 Tax=Leptospira kirschneri str. H1 TaxID=1049966 RepID=A0A0E2B006_9LEPT|nr:hypothetical protein LEP1GSC081_1758 [Leptospira kirschneri str. H1]
MSEICNLSFTDYLNWFSKEVFYAKGFGPIRGRNGGNGGSYRSGRSS